MAIYLDEQVGPHLKYLLKKRLLESPKDFVAGRLLKMVEQDDERKATMETCEHNFQDSVGHHVNCTKCGGLKDGFEEWHPISFMRERGVDNPPSSKDDSAIPHSIPTQPDPLQLL